MIFSSSHPQEEIETIADFLRQTFDQQKKKSSVIAVSGGIDSAVSLSLLTKAIPKDQIFPILLPYGNQNMDDAEEVIRFWNIPESNIHRVNIQPIVKVVEQSLQFSGESGEQFRKGNIMARARMIVVFDFAKKLDALVCGTENKSEKYLAYFTRFGDEASDIEPIQHLYKTQIRQLAEHFKLPESILTKAPSAGLWQGQTDEQELGFSYEQADQVLVEYIDHGKKIDAIEISDIKKDIVQKVINRVESQHFKHIVPYHLDDVIVQ